MADINSTKKLQRKITLYAALGILFIGIILLLIGILIRKLTQMETLGLVLIITGVCCKAIYIINKARNGEYKPGKELVLLVVGLLLFFTGLYYRGTELSFINPIYLMMVGIAFKIFFILQFIRKIRAGKNKV